MLLVDIHQFDVVLGNTIILRVFKNEIEHIRCIVGLERQQVIVLRSTEHLLQRRKIDSEGNIAVTAVWREGVGLQLHGH